MTDDRQKLAAMTALSNYMQRQRMRKTPERFAIFERILALDDHFIVDDLYEAMEQSDYRVSRATIYNTVNLLVDAGLLIRHKFAGQHSHYERKTGTGSHYHLVCTQCGKIKEIVDPEIDATLARKTYGSFTPALTELNIYGLCRSCMKKARRSDKKDGSRRGSDQAPHAPSSKKLNKPD